jgi:uncharacterized protein with HEPN domain
MDREEIIAKRETKLYVGDIKNAIKKIERYTSEMSFGDFANDEKTFDAVIWNIIVIGEAIANIPEEIKGKYSGAPWNEMVGMHNKMMYEYFEANNNIVWETIKEDLPKLKEQIEEIIL